MAEVQRTKRVKAGDWRTLESGWNANFTCLFVGPNGAEIKIRYGAGWIFGKDSQHQTLDGIHTKSLNVGKGSLAYARVQMKVRSDADVTYTYVASGP
jgi:hypothetical protein